MMMKITATHGLLRLVAALFFVLPAVPCIACCTVWGAKDGGVKIAAQEVLIHWDSQTGIEHFVRRADFDARSLPDDFGFLVPTPTQPKLGEAPDRVFAELRETIKPELRIETTRRASFTPLALLFLTDFVGCGIYDAASRSVSAVEVLDTAVVGGFEAAVLRATEVDSLLEWLEENGYDARPELREWLEPYIEKQWIVTAFKYACDPEDGARSLSREAVCMSFPTDAPFFPYRVPSDLRVEPEDGSLLRIYYSGAARVTGRFEAGADRAWKSKTSFSNRVGGVAGLLDGVGGMSKDDADFPKSTWLTAFEDSTWPGGAEDLYFTASDDSTAVMPPPFVRHKVSYVRIPADVVLGALFFGFAIYRRGKKDAAA